MLITDDNVEKGLKKYKIPKNIYLNIYNALIEIDKTKKLDLFDIEYMKGNYSVEYYRIRKGKYRAIFYFDDNNTILDFVGNVCMLKAKRGYIQSMETIKVTKKEKELFEVISQIKNLSMEDILEALEDLSDRKLVERLEADKKANPNRQFTTHKEIMKKVYGEDVE